MTAAPLSAAELDILASTFPPLESFGPGSDAPWLAIDLTDSVAAHGSWLQSLPCPVIGIGDGALAPYCDVVLQDTGPLGAIAANIAHTPVAAMVLVQHLRVTEQLPMHHALTAESMAYATVQNGQEFRQWHSCRAHPPAPPVENGPPLLVSNAKGRLRLTMNRPVNRNGIGMEMRDALVEAFDMALIDPDVTGVDLEGAGKCFSVGGEVTEFGQASDPATAHWVRTLRLPARRLVQLGGALTVRVQGAAIGAGVEIAAFAKTVIARPDAWFQLPELKYGLIPGAGGTVSIPRRIGRQRTAYMALSMRRIPAALALEWGLVDAIAA